MVQQQADLVQRVVDFASATESVLRHLQQRIGLDTWILIRRIGPDCFVLGAVDSTSQLHRGDVMAWQDTLCSLMVDGTGPRLAPDVDQVPAYVSVRGQGGCQPGSYIGAPVRSPGGELLGSLCGFSGDRHRIDAGADVAGVELQAELLGVLLHHELRMVADARRAERADLSATTTDLVTGLGDGRAWDAAMAAEEIRTICYGSPAAVLVVDLDGLKSTNDSFGYEAGDELLLLTATVLQASVRPQDLVVRWGGGQFAVLLPETDAAAADTTAARLRESLTTAGVAASLGVGVRGAATDVQEAWRDAHAAMRAAKPRRATPSGQLAPVTQPRPAALAPATDAQQVDLDSVDALLELARAQLGMDVAFLGEVRGTERLVRNVVSGIELPVGAGFVQPLEETHCQLILDGRIPQALPDTSVSPDFVAVPITAALDIQSYLGVPVHRSNGELYGTLCAFSQRVEPTLRQRDAGALRVLAGVVMHLVEREELAQAARRATLTRLDRVYDAGGPSCVYQPVVRLDTGAVVGFEALSRFPEGGPDEWFRAAAAAGVGPDLELRAVASGVRVLPDLEGFLAVNLSANAVRDPRLLHGLHRLPLERLVIELTEHEAVDDYLALAKVLEPLRARGLRVAIDDAGAGFASMRHILALRPDLIKLDMSIVRGVETDPTRHALVAALLAFATQTGATMVAEGIETLDELSCLRSLGVPLGQGYYLARPAPWSDTEPAATSVPHLGLGA